MKGAKVFNKVFYSAMKNFGKKEKGVSFSGLNVILFLSPDRMSSGNDVTSDKVNFRSDIRQNLFLEKIKISRVFVALKTFWSSCTLINQT